jgi:hypothetical protein
MSMNRRNGENGENGNSVGRLLMQRYHGSLLSLMAAIMAGSLAFGFMQAQIAQAGEDIRDFKVEQKILQEYLRAQATTNGAIDERTKAIQRQLATLITRIDRQTRETPQ